MHPRLDAYASYGQLLSGSPPDDLQLGSADNGGGIAASTSAPSTPAVLRIVVDDPVKKVENSMIPGVQGGYVTYRVATASALSTYAHKDTSVRRRFRDFVVCK